MSTMLMAIELEDERGAELGDPRRCSKHGIATSVCHGADRESGLALMAFALLFIVASL